MVDGWYEFWRFFFSNGRMCVEVFYPAVCLVSDKTAYDVCITYCSVGS